MDGILENAVDKVFSRVKKREIFTLQIRLFFAIYNNFIFPENIGKRGNTPSCSVQNNIKPDFLPYSVQNIILNDYTVFPCMWQGIFALSCQLVSLLVQKFG